MRTSRTWMLTCLSLLALLGGPTPAEPAPADVGRDTFVLAARPFGLVRGDHVVMGTLDTHGEFAVDNSFYPLTVQRSSGGHWSITGSGREYSLSSIANLECLADGPKPLVYEYRSGSLVPGRFGSYGWFVPEIGAKILAFAEYQPAPDVPRIYNLPGHWAAKDKPTAVPPAKP